MAPLAGLAGALVAHGGLGGALVEVGLAVCVAAFFLAVWLRERRSRSQDDEVA